VYLAVWGEYRTGDFELGKYWKNSQAIPFTDGSNMVQAISIAVLDGNIYVAGQEVNSAGFVLKYWKNSQSTIVMTNNPQVHSTSMVVIKR
jgi:hypothetical protein